MTSWSRLPSEVLFDEEKTRPLALVAPILAAGHDGIRWYQLEMVWMVLYSDFDRIWYPFDDRHHNLIDFLGRQIFQIAILWEDDKHWIFGITIQYLQFISCSVQLIIG